MKSLREIFKIIPPVVEVHEHKLRIIAVEHPRVVPPAFAGTTIVLYRCDSCSEVRSVTVNGAWTLEQLAGVSDE